MIERAAGAYHNRPQNRGQKQTLLQAFLVAFYASRSFTVSGFNERDLVVEPGLHPGVTSRHPTVYALQRHRAGLGVQRRIQTGGWILRPG